MNTITKERIELFINDPLENGLTRGEQMELARIALSSLKAKPIITNYWMPAVGEHCEVRSPSRDIEWLRIKAVAINGCELAAVVCDPDAHDYGHLDIFGWEYDKSVFRPLSGGDVESSPISAEDTLR